MSPRFSIIIPAYNAAKYLRHCLDSIAKQTFGGWEIIGVDDGSTDSTAQIFAEYAAKDRRVKVLNQKRSGVSVSRNRGILEAKGEYIGFLDGDDFVSNSWLADVDRIARASIPDIVRMNLTYCDETGLISGRRKFCNEAMYEKKEDILVWAWKTYPNGGWACLNFIRRELLAKCGARFKEKMAIKEDVIFGLDVAMHASRVVQSDKGGYFYRQHRGSAWHKRRRLLDCITFFSEGLRIWDEQREYLVEACCENIARKELGDALWQDFMEWLDHGVRAERQYSAKLILLVESSVHQGLIMRRNLPKRWQIGFLWLRYSHSLSLIYLTWWIQAGYRRIRGKQ